MKPCLRCNGLGAKPPILFARPEAYCWVCRGSGELEAPNALDIYMHVLSRHAPHDLKPEAPKPSYKEAMSMITKKPSLGNIANANLEWRLTILGRRCTYVWCTIHLERGGRTTTAKFVDMLGTKYDPYIVELNAIIQDIKSK